MISRHLLWTILAPLLATQGIHAATIAGTHFTMFQEYSVAPVSDSGGTPGWASYLDNMKTAATPTGFVNAGDPSTPGYFEVSNGIVPLSHVTVTGFPGSSTVTPRRFKSWRGVANPGTAFGAAFANEYGSRLHSPLLVVSNGGPFTMTSLERKVYSEYKQPGGSPWQSASAPLPNTLPDLTSFSAARIGVTSFGGNGVLGGGDDTYITTGSMASTPLLAFITTGPGSGGISLLQQYDGTPWPVSTPNEDIYETFLQQWQDDLGDTPFDLRMEYKVNYTVASVPFSTTLSGDQINVVPEPSAWVLAIAGSIALLRRRRS